MKPFLLGRTKSNSVHAIHDFGEKETIFVSACCKDFENIEIIDGNPNDITCGLCLTKLWDKLCSQQLNITTKEEYDKYPPSD